METRPIMHEVPAGSRSYVPLPTNSATLLARTMIITQLGFLVRRCSLERRVASCLKVVNCERAMSTPAKPKVFITRRVPESGPSLLEAQCDISQWDKDDVIPRSELLSSVKGVDALFCLLTDKIDSEVLDAAGETSQPLLPRPATPVSLPHFPVSSVVWPPPTPPHGSS